MPYQSNSAASDGDLARFDLRHPGHAVVRPPAARRLSAWLSDIDARAAQDNR